MRRIALLLISAGLAVAGVPVAVQAAPAAIAAAVAAKDRPAEARAMDAGRKPVEVLTFLGLERGDHALDIITTSGYWAEIMGRAVGPKGSVIGQQPASYFPDVAKQGWETIVKRAPNVHLMLTPGKLSFAPDSFDFVMLNLNYHDLYAFNPAPPTLPAELFAAVKPGGIVGVIDHAALPGGDPHAVGEKLHRIDPAVVRADFEAAGFVLDGQSDLLRNPDDDHSKNVFTPDIQGKTDRFVFRFKKPA